MGSVIISATAFLAVFGATAPDASLKVEEVIRRAVKANNTAQKAVRSGGGEGRCVFVLKSKAAGKLPPEQRYEGTVLALVRVFWTEALGQNRQGCPWWLRDDNLYLRPEHGPDR